MADNTAQSPEALIALWKDRTGKASRQATNLRDQVNHLSERLAAVEAARASAEEERDASRRAESEFAGVREALESDLSDCRRSRKHYKKEYMESTNKILELRQGLDDYRMRLQQRDEEAELHQAEAAQMKTILMKLEERLEGLEADVTAAALDRDECKARAKSIQEEKDHLQQICHDAVLSYMRSSVGSEAAQFADVAPALGIIPPVFAPPSRPAITAFPAISNITPFTRESVLAIPDGAKAADQEPSMKPRFFAGVKKQAVTGLKNLTAKLSGEEAAPNVPAVLSSRTLKAAYPTISRNKRVLTSRGDKENAMVSRRTDSFAGNTSQLIARRGTVEASIKSQSDAETVVGEDSSLRASSSSTVNCVEDGLRM